MAMAEHSAFYLIKYIPEENVLGGCTCKVTDTFQTHMFLYLIYEEVPKMALIPVMTWHHERRDDKEKTHLRADQEI